ncbi:MAG: fibro-slime domain-containing protein, partial [Clostridiales bacterium]|nr:fibro-slime domain-containing protein [Clostridiales bacterium]
MSMKREFMRLSKAEGRLRRNGRRLTSMFLCASLVVGNLSVTPIRAWADSDSDNEYTYEIESADLQEALRTAVAEESTVDEELVFSGEHAEEYAELLEADGTLYELELPDDEDDEEDRDRDKALNLRIFARIEGTIPVDEAYEINGAEEIVFLLSNKTEETVTATICVDDLETEEITILPADSISVEDDSNETGSVETASGTVTDGRSVGGSGSGSSGGSAGGSTGEAADIEITDTEDDEDEISGTLLDDSDVSASDDEVSDDSTSAKEDDSDVSDQAEEEKDSSDEEAAEDQTQEDESENTDIEDSDSETADPSEDTESQDTSEEDEDAGTEDSKDTADGADDNTDTEDTNDTDAKTEDTGSGDRADDDTDAGDTNDTDTKTEDTKSNDNADNKTDGKDTGNADTSATTDSGSNAASDVSESSKSNSAGDTSDADSGSDTSDHSDLSALTPAISIHKSVLVTASRATASDAYEKATSSNTSRTIDGTIYESVQYDKKGTTAFVTTAADLNLDEVEYVEYVEYTAQEKDITVTVTAPVGALSSKAELVVTLYDEDSEEYAAAGESINYDTENTEIGMAALDITFYDENGEEEEPSVPVTVSIDISSVLSDDVDTSSIEVQHLAETDDGVEPVLVADATDDTYGSVDEEAAVVEFDVESFSEFVITWALRNNANTSIVLNLGNGNGTYSDGDYTGSKSSGGSALRYTVDLSNAYLNEDNTVTINLPYRTDLPEDSSTKSTFYVVEKDASQDGEGITIELECEKAYNYRLVGWYNIATGDYYDVEYNESGSYVTVDVDLSKNNVFYADWIAESYDYGSSSNGNLIETKDTSSFVQIHMFDYNELFNLYSTTLTQNGTSSESWSDSGNLYKTPPLALENTPERLANSFIFLNNGTNKGVAPNNNGTGLIGFPSDLKGWNIFTGNSASKGNGNLPYQGIVSSTDDAVLSKLYDQSAGTTGDDLGVYYVGEGNYLFSYDDTTGYYSYDSEEHAASYNRTDGRFYVYDSPQTISGGTASSYFLPYNTHGDGLDDEDGSVNYWFGMNLELDFYLPNDTGTTGGNQINGEDMIFNFSGDDDIWVFVDNELVLDMGGNHNALDGSIDFSSGAVSVTGESDTTVSLTAGSHTLKVYYMERGGWASNMKISFNVVSRWELETATAGVMSVAKEWKDADGNEITDTSSCPTVTMGLFENTGVEASAGNTYTVTVNGVETTYDLDANGYSYDTDDVINAYISSGYLYVRVDKQNVNENNNWTYIWELLDMSKTYEVKELTTLSGYITKATSSDLNNYDYWVAADGDDLNGTTTDDAGYKSGGILKDGLQILLTDGAQNGEASSTGFPITYTGYVINSGDGISTVEAQFSQKAEKNSDGSYTYGVTSDTYINETSIWTVELIDDGYQSTTIQGKTEYVPAFRLKDSKGNYLAIEDKKLITVESSALATAFSYNSLGELNTDDQTGLRVIIDESGGYALVEGRQASTDLTNVKIYVKQEVGTEGERYTITNIHVPTITLKKVDSTNDETKLSGAVFTLRNETGAYYSYVGGNVVWNDSEAVNLTTGTGGIIYLYSLPDGAYTLEEVTAPDGYDRLSGTITITVENGAVVLIEGAENTFQFDSETAIITIKNTPEESGDPDNPTPDEPTPEEQYGSLTVSKKVAGSGADTSQEFTFTVTLSDTGINGSYGDMDFIDGVATFTLKHNESVTASGLPEGITYVVSETAADGYTTTRENASGTIKADTEIQVIFTNTKDSGSSTDDSGGSSSGSGSSSSGSSSSGSSGSGGSSSS